MHDLIRFVHEMGVREMFPFLSAKGEGFTRPRCSIWKSHWLSGYLTWKMG
jgi:hypothetical protein